MDCVNEQIENLKRKEKNISENINEEIIEIRIDRPPPSRVSKLPEIQLFQFKIILLPFLESQTHLTSHPPRNIL